MSSTLTNIHVVKKNNAMRVLDAQKLNYRVVEYDAAKEFHSAAQAAALIGAPVETVYKTLVVLREAAAGGPRPKPLLVMVASHRELDLRLLAKSIGEKKLRMATKKEAEQLTGAQIGAISALAHLNKGFQVLLDKPAMGLEKIHISGGERGVDIELAVADLLRVTNARLVEATEEG
jgi:Cys-tRNA(Pro)/Cys-tRNA(Cys) deacylase